MEKVLPGELPTELLYGNLKEWAEHYFPAPEGTEPKEKASSAGEETQLAKLKRYLKEQSNYPMEFIESLTCGQEAKAIAEKQPTNLDLKIGGWAALLNAGYIQQVVTEINEHLSQFEKEKSITKTD